MPPWTSKPDAAAKPSGMARISAGRTSQRRPPRKDGDDERDAQRDHEAGDRRAAAHRRADGDGDEADRGDDEQQQARARAVAARAAGVLGPARGPPQQDADDRDQPEADERRARGRTRRGRAARSPRARAPTAPAMVAARLRSAGASPGSGSGGHEDPGGEIGEHAGAARHREHDEADAEDDRVDVEVAAEAAGHAGDDLVGGGTGEPAGNRRGDRGAGGEVGASDMAARLPDRRGRANSGSPPRGSRIRTSSRVPRLTTSEYATK